MKFQFSIPLIAIMIGGIAGIFLGKESTEPALREITVIARQYAFNPEVINVNRGDTLRIKLASLDVTHGFYLEGHDVDARVSANQKTFKFRNPSKSGDWKEVEEFEVIADHTGKYRYRCSQTCGSMHPFMQGELIVNPNLPFYAGIGSTIGLVFGMGLVFWRRSIVRTEDINE